jgi:hypothetical protein
MTGQRIRDARRVVVLVEDVRGRQYAWEVLQPQRVEWEHLGMISHSAHARVVVTGEFHRMSKSPESREIEAALNRPWLDGPSPDQITEGVIDAEAFGD